MGQLKDHFEVEGACTDHVEGIFKTVRIPTAQMDLFALLMQLAADHLMSERSSQEDRNTFKELGDSNRKMKGAGYLWPSLEQAPKCMRAVHWYRESTTAAAA